MDRIRSLPPRILALAGVAVLLLIAGAAYAIASGGGDSSSTRTTTRAGAGLDVAPTATLTATPAATSTPEPVVAQPNRMNCAAITGTAYQSDDERGWYIQNCSSGGSGGAAPSTVSGPAAAPAAGQAPMGDRIVIPAAGVSADVWRAVVPSSGQMPDPVGYFNAVYYDFSNLPGHGGNTSSGNVVLSGHVDCARCYNGGSGIAVFWHIRNLGVGDTAQYISANGTVNNYVVVSSRSYSPNIDWSGIVASGAADMTLITCTGNFSGGDYSLRHVVQFRKV